MTSNDVDTKPRISARKSARKKGDVAAKVRWQGWNYSIIRERNGLLRLRSRSKKRLIDVWLETRSVTEAKEKALEELKKSPGQSIKGTLADVIRVYPTLSLGCNDTTARENVGCLKRIVELATGGKSLVQAKLADLAEIWPAYIAARQDLDRPNRKDKGRPNYSIKRTVHTGIRSTLMQARAIFIRSLHPQYRAAGITMPPDVENIKFPKALHREPPPVDEAALLKAWGALKEENRQFWLLVGIAWFVGPRAKEIKASRWKWIVPYKGGHAFVLKDRPEDSYSDKTGRIRQMPIRNPEFAAELVAAAAQENPEALILGGIGDRQYAKAMKWLRQFTGARTPAHALRGRHAAAIKEAKIEEILARKAGDQAAADALHGPGSNTAVVRKHYLPADEPL